MTAWDALHGDKPTDVYWIYDAADRLLYVGMTYDIEQRLANHQTGTFWFSEAARVETETLPTRSDAALREWAAIAADNPLYNVRRVPPIARPLPPIVKRDRLASVTQLLADEDA